MATSPKDRVLVTGNLAAIARTRKIEPIDPDDPAMAFMPPLASVEELSSSGATPTRVADVSASTVGTPPTDNVEFPIESLPPEVLPTSGAQPQHRDKVLYWDQSQRPTSPPAHGNKAKSADYTRVTLRLRNDVITRLVAHGLSRHKRYTTVIEDFIMAGLDRHKD